MQTYIALLRGINVGGTVSLKMKDLAATLKAAGFEAVRTYIQSGNVVFSCQEGDAAVLAVRMTDCINAAFGVAPSVIVLPAEEVAAIAADNPFPEATAEPKFLHFFFLNQAAEAADIAKMTEIAAADERFHLSDRCFYLHTPSGFGRSKLAARAEALLGTTATARNWRTVTTLLEMAGLDG